MKLYYIPGACSLAVNIGLRVAKLPFELMLVDYQAQTLPDGSDYHSVNPTGIVPTLQLDDGSCLSEVISIFYYLAMRYENTNLLGPHEHRQQAIEWLSFLATEIHKSFSPLFRADTPMAFHEPGKNHLRKRLAVIEQKLAKQAYLIGNCPTAADYYLFTLYRWMPDVNLSAAGFSNILKHSESIEKIIEVQSALFSERVENVVNEVNEVY